MAAGALSAVPTTIAVSLALGSEMPSASAIVGFSATASSAEPARVPYSQARKTASRTAASATVKTSSQANVNPPRWTGARLTNGLARTRG